MFHERFVFTEAHGEATHLFRAELWGGDEGRVIVCIDYEGQPSREFFEGKRDEVRRELQDRFDLPEDFDLFAQTDDGQYERDSKKLSYSEIARDGYRLLGLEHSVFSEVETDGRPDELIMEGGSSFEFEGQEALAVNFHLWSNRKEQGWVLLDFDPDDKWIPLMEDEPFQMIVEATYGLRRGAVIAVPLRDDPVYGRQYVLLKDYLAGTEEFGTATYSEFKFSAASIVDEALGRPQIPVRELTIGSRPIEIEL